MPEEVDILEQFYEPKYIPKGNPEVEQGKLFDDGEHKILPEEKREKVVPNQSNTNIQNA